MGRLKETHLGASQLPVTRRLTVAPFTHRAGPCNPTAQVIADGTPRKHYDTVKPLQFSVPEVWDAKPDNLVGLHMFYMFRSWGWRWRVVIKASLQRKKKSTGKENLSNTAQSVRTLSFICVLIDVPGALLR